MKKIQDQFADLSVLEKRAEGIRDWLRENGRGCFEEQEHIHAGTKGKIYWHYGYMAALLDVMRYLTGDKTTVPLTCENPRTQQPDICN